jgi:hypothetical protein
MLALAGVLLFLVAAETAREMTNAEQGPSVASNLGYAVAEALVEVYIVTGGILVIGGLLYLLSYLRGRRVTRLEAIFNWAVVVAAAGVALLTLCTWSEPPRRLSRPSPIAHRTLLACEDRVSVSLSASYPDRTGAEPYSPKYLEGYSLRSHRILRFACYAPT